MTRLALRLLGHIGITTLLACNVGAILVATVSRPDAGAVGDAGDGAAWTATNCHTDDDCGDAGPSFCNRAACEDDAGTCTPIPLNCFGDEARPVPVCGCDGVTYWSRCISEFYGQSIRDDGGVCDLSVARTCDAGSASTCPRGLAGYCAEELPRLLSPPGTPPPVPCQPAPHGPPAICWVLPDCSTVIDDSLDFISCPETADAGPLQCVNLCTAIADRQPFQQDPTGAVCGGGGP